MQPTQTQTPPPPPVWNPATNTWEFPQAQPVAPAAPSGYPAASEFGDPAAKVDRPRWKTLYGRLLIIEPISIERNVINELGRPDPATGQKPRQDRMTCNVTVLDGEPFTYGGRPDATPAIPDHLRADVPCEFQMLSSHKMIVSQCEWALPKPGAATGGKVLGRLSVSDREPRPGENRAWRLQPATDADKRKAAEYTAQRANQALGVPAQAPPAPVAQAAPMPPAAAMVAAPSIDLTNAPSNIPAAVWNTFSDEQKLAIAQSAAAQPAY